VINQNFFLNFLIEPEMDRGLFRKIFSWKELDKKERNNKNELKNAKSLLPLSLT